MVESNFLLGPVAGTILSLPLFDGGNVRQALLRHVQAMNKDQLSEC
jgi:outer membrane protein TolC